jgi:hypothetical protein
MKTIYIENVLILVNLILILYLVYVISNRTIEKFFYNTQSTVHNHAINDNKGCIDYSVNKCENEGIDIL